MTNQELSKTASELNALSVFRGVLKYDTMSYFIKIFTTENKTERLSLFGNFVYSLMDYDFCFSDFLSYVIFTDENHYIVSVANKKDVSDCMKYNAVEELKLFSKLTEITSSDIEKMFLFDGYIPKFSNNKTDFQKEYEKRLLNISKYGYGIFATAKMFRVSGEEILPIESVDDISLDSFVGYEDERQRVFENTRALSEGKTAQNTLLCGDAGTGKSSTVKACANYFADFGVRLIEIRKDQLFSLSHIMGRISNNPLKFIIFIDDLSFNKNDDCFSMLKAALEGSASAKASNAVIYATSNRRHIVKESFSDREPSDDVHHSDTVQELMSLSDRFGLSVYFERPNKALYLEIIHSLARKNDINIDEKELDIKAEAFALSRGSRSPRAAEQFINSLK